MSYVLFPYERVPKDSRVIIYGMGYLGQMFAEQIAGNNYCDLLFAADKDYQSKKSELLAVKQPEAIFQTEYDFIVIAILSVSIAESVKTELVKMGVPAEKCIYKYVELESNSRNLSGIEGFLRGRIGRILYGLESYAENEYWRRTCPDWECSWLNEKFQQIQNALTVYRIDEPHRFVRIGRNGDGGYLILDNYPQEGSRVLYAFGVGGDVSFEYQMAEQGWQIYMYDHTVSKLPQEHRSFHYQKRGLTGRHDELRSEFSTLPDLLAENGHLEEQDMLLKMDIEGYEVDVFRNLPGNLQSKFAQIVLELHGLGDIGKWDAILEALAGIERTHKLVHLHANNWSPVFYIGNGMLSEALELTFVRTADWHFSVQSGLLLNPLDVRCDNMRPERLVWQ